MNTHTHHHSSTGGSPPARGPAWRRAGLTVAVLATVVLVLGAAPAGAATDVVVAAPDFFAWASGLFASVWDLLLIGFLVIAGYVVVRAFFKGGAVAALITGVGAAVIYWVVQNTEFLAEIADATFGA